MQIHYHPAGAVNDPDITSIDLRSTNVWPQKMYFVSAFGNAFAAPNLLPDPDDRTALPEFRIPANKADHEEHMTFAVGDLGGLQNVQLYSVNPHMHLVGTHINSTIIRPGRARCRSADRVPRERQLELRLAAHVHLRHADRIAADREAR